MEKEKSDAEIIELCKSDKSNFKQIYNKYSDIIYNFCLLLTKNENDAEEITQETFIKLYLAIKKFNPKKGKLKSYIFKIAQNAYINFRKKRKTTCSLPGNKSTGHTILDKIIKNETENEILELLKSISLRDRTAFILNRIQHYSIDTVAGIMNISKQEVKNKVLRVKKKLMKEFNI